MNDRATEARWERLTRLLAPFHDQAVVTARRLCRSAADGDDLYQETVVRAFDKLDSLRHEGSFRSWFYAALLLRHRSRSRVAFWRRFVSLEAQLEQGREPVGEPGDEWAERALQAHRVAQALSQLPDVQREAIVLFEMQGFSIEEIAGMQQVSQSAVKTRLARGRQSLRRFYEKRGWAESAPTSGTGARLAVVAVGAREASHE